MSGVDTYDAYYLQGSNRLDVRGGLADSYMYSAIAPLIVTAAFEDHTGGVDQRKQLTPIGRDQLDKAQEQAKRISGASQAHLGPSLRRSQPQEREVSQAREDDEGI